MQCRVLYIPFMYIEYTCMYAFYHEIIVRIPKRISRRTDLDPRAVLHIL